jgi:uncharacterized protein YbjT (DUF2867 family)
MILITGASGSLGGAVLREFAKNKRSYKAMYRSQDDAAHDPAGTDVVIADFADEHSMSAAFRGVESVFLVCAPIPELVQLESNAIEACQAAGVQRIVLSSALGAGDYNKSFPSWHRKAEDKLRASGMKYCILRPNAFHQNIVAFYAPSIRAQGAFYAAMGDARLSYLDVRDIAAVAAKALRGECDGRILELNGPEALSCSAIATKISKQARVAAKFVDIPEDAQRKAMLDLGMPEWQVTALLDLQRYFTSGHGGDVDDTLKRLLDRSPIKIDDFLAEFADEFRRQSAKA